AREDGARQSTIASSRCIEQRVRVALADQSHIHWVRGLEPRRAGGDVCLVKQGVNVGPGCHTQLSVAASRHAKVTNRLADHLYATRTIAERHVDRDEKPNAFTSAPSAIPAYISAMTTVRATNQLGSSRR
ncbi:MAG: hypothetical protein ACREBE_28960, partial [bacterium]